MPQSSPKNMQSIGVPARDVHHAQVVVDDAVEQFVDEGGLLHHVAEQVGHRAQRPRALKQRKADRIHAEALGLGTEPLALLADHPLVRLGQAVGAELGFGELVLVHNAEVALLYALVPHYAECVAEQAL